LWNKYPDPKTNPNPNTMCLQITLGGNHGSGHFYLAKNRTFLLCVDTLNPPAPYGVEEARKERYIRNMRKAPILLVAGQFAKAMVVCVAAD